jgi:hypothetical protein
MRIRSSSLDLALNFWADVLSFRSDYHVIVTSAMGQNPNGASGLGIPVSPSADMVRESIPLGKLCQSA